MKKIIINTKNAPEAIGPYSQAVLVDRTLYCSGQIAINPNTNKIDFLGDIKVETTQVLNNLKAVLTASGASLEDVIKTTIYLTDLNNFQIVNEIYSEFFQNEPSPARACVEVSSLPKGVLIEIDCVAYIH